MISQLPLHTFDENHTGQQQISREPIVPRLIVSEGLI